MSKSTTALAHRPSVLSPDLFAIEATPPANGKVATPTGIIIGSAYIPKPRPNLSLVEWRLQERMLRHGMPRITTMERISRPSQTVAGRIVAAFREWL